MQVTLCDVGPRDGLHNEQTVLEPTLRAELVNRLAAAGPPAVEAVSFVHPARVPRMAGAEDVVAGIERRTGVACSGLVLDEKSYERFAATGLGELRFDIAATESFAPRATGNVATEDLVYLLHGEGVETGVDLDALIGVSDRLEAVLGRELPGRVYRAGAFTPVSG